MDFCAHHFQVFYESPGSVFVNCEFLEADLPRGERRVVVDRLDRHVVFGVAQVVFLLSVLFDLDEIVVPVAVALSGDEVKPHKPVELLCDRAQDIDLLLARHNRLVQVGRRNAVSAFALALSIEFASRVALGLLHEKAELTLVAADGILDHQVLAAERLGGVLRGEVQVHRLLRVPVGAVHAEQHAAHACAAVELGLEDELSAGLRLQQIGLPRHTGAERLGAYYVRLLGSGIDVARLEPEDLRLDDIGKPHLAEHDPAHVDRREPGILPAVLDPLARL